MSRFYQLTAPCLVLFVAGAMTRQAHASDLTITSNFSNTVEYNDNFLLRSTGPSSGVLGAYSTISLLAVQRTPTTSLDIGGNFSYRKYFGPGASQLSTTENTSDGLNIRFEKSGKLQADKDYIAASYRRADAALAQRQDIGVATVSGDIITYSANGGGSRQVTALDTLSWNGTVTSTTYSPSGSGTAFTNYLAGGSWTHRLNQVLDFIASSDVTFLSYDDKPQTRTTIYRATGGIRSKLSDRLTFTANGGAAVVKTTQENPGAPVATAIDPITGLPVAVAPTPGGATIGPVWDVGLTYNVTRTDDFSLQASQSVTPGVIGTVSTRTSLIASYVHRVNSASALTFAFNATHFDQGSTAPVADTYTASAAYSYRFTREWNARLLYTYRMRNVAESSAGPGGSAASNSIMFTLTQDATLKP